VSDYVSGMVGFTVTMLCLITFVTVWHRDLAMAGPQGQQILMRRRSAYHNFPPFSLEKRPLVSVGFTSMVMIMIASVVMNQEHPLGNLEILLGVACAVVLVVCGFIAEFIVDMAIEDYRLSEIPN
jgi:hypothetical protein